MASSNLLNEGLTLMLFGMGFVFIFLTLLVFATSLMSRLVTEYEDHVGVLPKGGVPSPTAVIPQHGPLASISQQQAVEQEPILPVLTAAIEAHRQHRR